MAERVHMQNLDKGIAQIMGNFIKHNSEVVGKGVANLPRKFRTAAIKFYGSVLGVRTGRLRQSFEEVSRQEGDGNWSIGLKSDVEYAAVHEFGFSGTVNVREHTRNITQAFGRPIEPTVITVRAHDREMSVREKRFFRDPIADEVDKFTKRLLKKIGFGLE